MKRIARRLGAPTDTSCDYDLTDWDSVQRFADSLAESLTKVSDAVPA